MRQNKLKLDARKKLNLPSAAASRLLSRISAIRKRQSVTPNAKPSVKLKSLLKLSDLKVVSRDVIKKNKRQKNQLKVALREAPIVRKSKDLSPDLWVVKP